ncbi:hypothetical protein J2Y02_002361 [Neobacillus drentensis]|nr:hypothetical protein [Neobacillus drentensis]
MPKRITFKDVAARIEEVKKAMKEQRISAYSSGINAFFYFFPEKLNQTLPKFLTAMPVRLVHT